MPKRKIVMFLGAGASKAFKYPVTSQILGLIVQSIKSNELFRKAGIPSEQSDLYRLMLKRLFLSLSPGLSKVFDNTVSEDSNDLPLITDLLSQVEHFANSAESLLDWNYEIKHALLGNPQGLNDRWDLRDIITLLDWAIIYIINQRGKYTRDKLTGFINWVRNCNQSTNSFVSIITTNFDYAVEWNLLTAAEAKSAHLRVDYGFNWRDVEGGEIYLRPADPRFRFFKLHGSVDWLKCERCGFIYVNPTEDIYSLSFSNKKIDATKCHCDYWPLKPVLVTPSFNRNVRDTNLSQIWRNALEELRLADEWVIVGYSLPGEDFNIRSLFMRALNGRKRRPVIKVIQPDATAKPRYDYFFGKIQFIPRKFEEYDCNEIVKPTRPRKK
jgi:NAD-dependent SIR2 family protein deacetylase